jgi:CheY-like chemotaxis protein
MFRLVAVKKVVDSKNIKSKEYDIVLLDLDMPILDGYGACK